MIRILALLSWILAATLTHAAQTPYTLDTTNSTVSFTYQLAGIPTRGHMPVQSAEMLIDLDTIGASQVSVTMNASRARAGFLFATEAMRGPRVLDTENHPLITFRSTSIRGRLQGAVVTGDLTIRGVTRPVTMRAALYRQDDTDVTDRAKITVLLIGSVSRSAFGASGYPQIVADEIELRIIARIER